MQSGDKVIIQGPISIGRTLLYYFLIAPLIAVLITGISGFLPIQPYFRDIVFAVLAAICLWSLFLVVAKYGPSSEKIIVHRNRNTLQIICEKTRSEEYDMDSIKRFIVKKIICPSPGSKQYKLLLEKNDSTISELFSDEFAHYYRHRWLFIARKLTEITQKPVHEEAYLEKYDGTVVPHIEKGSATGYIYLLIPFLVSAFWAFLFGFYLTLRSFILLGVIAVLTNLLLFVLYRKKKEDKMHRTLDPKLTTPVIFFSLAIGFAVTYVLFAVIINGLGFLSKL
jgi:hypothetical protein